MSTLTIDVCSTRPTVTPVASKIDVTAPASQVIVAVEQGPPGPTGPQGPAGPAFTGTAWWYGEGTPETVVGSKPGDYYVDTLTGTVYELGGHS